MAEQDQNKSEKPTQHKLNEAKKKGQVAKSTELSGMLGLVLLILAGYALSGWLTDAVAKSFRQVFVAVGSMHKANSEVLISWTWDTLWSGYSIVFPILGIALVLGVALSLVQIGFIWSSESFKFDIGKMNPAKNLKKILSMKMLFESVKVLLKILAVVLLARLFGYELFSLVSDLRYVHPSEFVGLFTEILVMVGLTVGLVMLLFAFADFTFVKWSFLKQMRMSQREVKDEHKKMEGDPEIKRKRRQSQMELAKRLAGLAKIKEADVIITNPTHYAVALKFNPDQMFAPEVIVSGRGVLAALIRKKARKFSVVVKRNPPLARLLYKKCKVGGPIVAESFGAVASVYRELWYESSKSEGGLA